MLTIYRLDLHKQTVKLVPEKCVIVSCRFFFKEYIHHITGDDETTESVAGKKRTVYHVTD
jgi:hypothetical protein